MKRILVAIDGSPRSPGVLAAAISIARAHGAKLVLFRSAGLPPDVPQDFWKTTEESFLDVLSRRCRDYLNEQAASVPSELLGKTAVQIGVPWQAICEAAKHEDADLIVLGSHGYSGLDHVLGTTAAKVVNQAACSVLVVR